MLHPNDQSVTPIILTPTFKMEIKMRPIWARLSTEFRAKARFKQVDSESYSHILISPVPQMKS